MTFDDSQRAAISADTNTVVTAGAGSGKTTVLAERFVRLIRENKAPVDGILTLTFTRKAAAEMYDRIYRRLLREQDVPSVAAAIAHFETAQISTLDSFCSRIVRNDAGRFGITADFSVSEEEADRVIVEAALSFLLAYQDHPGIRALVAENGFDRTWHECLVPLGKEVFTLGNDVDLEAMCDRQIRALEEGLAQSISEIEAFVAPIEDLGGTSKTVAAAKEAAQAASVLRQQVAEGRYQAATRNLLRLSKIRKPSSKAKDPNLIELAAILPDLGKLCEIAAQLVASTAVQRQTEEAFKALGIYQGVIRRAKRNAGRLTFQDVVDMAVTSLATNTELRRHYKRRFRYIMIDEFQDNNESQKRLLYLLAEREERSVSGMPRPGDLDPGKLYFVGDEKQSIYRFRGADVRVFKSLAQELSVAGGSPIQLRRNYRSSPDLVAFFNEFFVRLLGEPAPDKKEYEADFGALQSGSEPRESKANIELLYKPYDGPNDDDVLSNDEAEAYAVARYIHNAVQSEDLWVGNEGGERPAGYDDFALLLRSGTAQATFERMFRLFEIPYNAGTVRSLFLEAPVNDIYNLLQLVVYSTDTLAYASLLRSPLVGCSDEAIVRLLDAGNRPFDWRGIAGIGETDARKLESGHELYEDIAAVADVVPPARLVSRIWYEWGYRYVLLADPRFHTYLEHYDYLHELALRYSDAPLAEFVDGIRPLLGKFERIPDLEVLGRDESGVQILTIHKSKGLEFPIVIVANMGNTGRADDSGSKPYYLSEEYGITFNLSPEGSNQKSNFFYRKGKEENDHRELAELKRILYVAATRAESHLVFSGYHHAANRKSDRAMLNLTIDALGSDPDSLEEGTRAGAATVHIIEDVPTSAVRGKTRHTGKRSLEEARSAYTSAGLVRRHSPRTEFAVTELNAVDASIRALAPGTHGHESAVPKGEILPSDELIEEFGLQTAFGTLCHTVIERSMRDPEQSVEVADLDWPSGVSEEHRHVLLSDAKTLARSFLRSAWWQEALHRQPRVDTEVEFLIRCPVEDSQCWIRGVVDLILTFEKETWILDFKTDHVLDRHDYDLQMGLYALAVADDAPARPDGSSGIPISTLLVHLRSGTPVALESGNEVLERAKRTITHLWSAAKLEKTHGS